MLALTSWKVIGCLAQLRKAKPSEESLMHAELSVSEFLPPRVLLQIQASMLHDPNPPGLIPHPPSFC